MTKDNGGPAFPCAAFGPSGDETHQSGMTLRDWFAGMALQGLLAKYGWDADLAGREETQTTTVADDIATDCYELADAMVEKTK